MRALLLCGLLAAAPVRAADAPTATATAAKAEVSVGEIFTVEVRADGPPGCTFTFPAELADESFLLSPLPGETGERVRRYQASVFAVGEAVVPPIAVRYRLAGGDAGEATTAPIPLRVITLLPKDKQEQKLADVRGPVRLSIARVFWIGLAVVAFLLIALAAWLWMRRRPAVPAPAVQPAVLPDEEARRALDALAASGRLGRGEYRGFYIDLTAIAKRYLERRLDAPIVEMTTAEMLAHLRHVPHTSEMGPLLRDLSGAADRIKYAQGSGAIEEGERHLSAVRALVDGLEARLAAPAPDSGRAA
jgi:hypothetical protein